MKKSIDIELYLMINVISNYLNQYYIEKSLTYEETVNLIKKYINTELKYYIVTKIDIKTVGFDKTQYRMFAINRDVNCGYGAEAY